MQHDKDQKIVLDASEFSSNCCEEKRIGVSVVSKYTQNLLRESNSLQNFDIARKVTVKGTRSQSLNNQRNKICPNDCCKAIFKSNAGSKVGGRSAFVSRRYSRWDDSQRSRPFESSQNITSTFSTNNVTNSNTTCERQLTPQNVLPNETVPTKVDFKTLLTMFLKRSSIYALNQVGNSASTRRKVFWTLIMIFGILGSGTQIIQYLVAYFKYPVVVNMDSKYTLDQEFPAVTVCNLNTVQDKYLKCLKGKINFKTCNLSMIGDKNLNAEFIDDGDCTLLNNNMSLVTLARYMWQNLYLSLDEESQKAYGHQIGDFIKSCSFNGEICTLKNFTESVDSHYGNCYTFNAANKSNPALKIPFVGPNGGLELELDIEVKKYTPYTRAVGARVQIHDPYQEQNVEQQGINVSPGFETSVTLSKHVMLRLKKPYKDKCKEYLIGDNMNACNERCFHSMIRKRCLCSFYGKGELRHCDLTRKSDICCIYRQPEKAETCDCPLSCNDTYYEINTFSAVWPSPAYYAANPVKSTANGEILTENKFRETRLKLKVYYDTLETVIYQQNAMYQNSEVFSQIGGQMGLWLGLSLVAIFECVENFILLWKYRAANLLQIRSLK